MATIYSKSGADAATAAAIAELNLGTAAAADAGDFATAAQGAKADASDVDQITLTGDLALTIPEGHPAGQVYRCAITQTTGGHTVTYGGNPVSVDTAAGASTQIELRPTGAGWVVAYPAGVALGDAASKNVGTTAGAVKAGDWKPAAADVTDSTAAGRALLTAATAEAQREAIRLPGLPYLDLARLGATHARTPLTTPTYDGSGQAVHPDVLVLDEPFGGYRYWMAMTPYPNGNDDVENPSILASDDGLTWVVPEGLTNPIDSNPPGFLPDPCLILDEGTLYCVYLGGLAKTSQNGVDWSARLSVTFGTYPGTNKMSPSIVKSGDTFHYWCVDGGASPNVLYHATGSTPLAYGDLSACTLNGGPAGRDLWHVSMRAIPGGYVGAFTYCTLDASGSGGTLHLATSPDGVTWTVGADPILSGATDPTWVSSMVYRACLVPTTGLGGAWARLWYSGLSLAGEWRIGHTALTGSRGNDALYNTALGGSVQANLTTGQCNIGIGVQSQAKLATGLNNVSVGFRAAQLATGSNNVAVGHRALTAPNDKTANATTTASRQTAIGTEAGQGSAVESNNITAVGYRATASGHAAMALGSDSVASHGWSVALGFLAETSALYQVAMGARHIELGEMTAPGVAPANKARLYVKDNGSGKTQLCVIFATGAEVVLATEA